MTTAGRRSRPARTSAGRAIGRTAAALGGGDAVQPWRFARVNPLIQPKGRGQVSATHEVLDTTRASDRQRHETRTRIRYARREGRLTQALCEASLEAASEAVTTADLAHLTSDLGTYEGPDAVRTMAVGLILVIALAAWEPFLLSGRVWLARRADDASGSRLPVGSPRVPEISGTKTCPLFEKSRCEWPASAV